MEILSSELHAMLNKAGELGAQKVIDRLNLDRKPVSQHQITARIILEGISCEELLSSVKDIIREEIRQADADKLRVISKKEACQKLGVTYKTLMKMLGKEGKEVIYTSDIEIWKYKYPKYSR